MRIFNERKTKELNSASLDFNAGELRPATYHHEAQSASPEQFHYEVIKEYDNGSKDVVRVVDKEGISSSPEWDEDIYVYHKFSKSELLENKLKKLRTQRQHECFSIINRGYLWYCQLTDCELKELDDWYHSWLDVTKTLKIPNKPKWLI